MTTRRHRLAAACCAAVLAGCVQLPAPPAGPATAEPVANNLSARFIGIVGPRQQHDPPFLDIPYTNFYVLRSFLDRQTSDTVHQLYVTDSYFGVERGWDAAHDGAGDALPFTHIGTDKIACETGCAYAEEFAATLPEAVLRASPLGLAVTFAARSGATLTINLAAPQIASQLAAVDAQRDRLPPPTAAAAAAP